MSVTCVMQETGKPFWSSESNVVRVCHVVQYAGPPYQCLKDHSHKFVLLAFKIFSLEVFRVSKQKRLS